MSAAGTPSTDPWVIVARERARYEEQFRGLKPINGIITGEQAKSFLLQSQLPPLVLGQIWALADTNADGKMDINEFSIACKLINLKLRGFEIPKVVPPNLIASLHMYAQTAPSAVPPPSIPPLPAVLQQQPPTIPSAPTTAPVVLPTAPVIPVQPILPPVQRPIVAPQPVVPTAAPQMMPPIVPVQPVVMPTMIARPVVPIQPLVSAVPPPAVQSPIGSITGSLPSASSTPRASIVERSGSIVTVDSPVLSSATPPPALPQSAVLEWSVPHQTKLKYTQIFNTTDRTRTGFLTGPQARNVMVQTKLPQNILAQIWALSDMDSDGRLGCEEFVLALHLCEQAALGVLPPTVLPPSLVPPSFRRGTRTASVSSQGSITAASASVGGGAESVTGVPVASEHDPASTLQSMSSFEDKRKENFEKGQAELERRRKTLLEQQRKESEERERKEREEMDRRERARQEAEKRRLDELERQMREQQEQERLKEEERKRQAEQREAARREMERQRQLEWEKQRSQELQQQRQREQENVLRLKAKNQSLTIELSSFNDQIRELSQKICDTRVGVSNVKTTIDGMRSTRDSQMQEMSQLKNRLKEQNARLLALSQEKVKLDAKNRLGQQTADQLDQQRQFDNKEINIKNLREKVEDLQGQIDGKVADIENNNLQLDGLRSQMLEMVGKCESLYVDYEQRRERVVEMKNAANTRSSLDYSTAWKDDGGWGDAGGGRDAWPVDNWATDTTTAAATTASETITAPATRYRALYEFVARNGDEISFQPGDIVNVPLEQTGEPGWLAGEIRGHTGWFPESYVEPLDGFGARDSIQSQESIEKKPLEGIAEIPETLPETVEPEIVPTTAAEPTTEAPVPSLDTPAYDVLERCIASYPYQSVEQGDLCFNAGDIVDVIKKDGDWWTGRLADTVGIFPSNYVQKYEPGAVTNNVAASVESTATESELVSAASAVVAAVSASNSATDSVIDSTIISQTDNEVSQIIGERKSSVTTEKSPDYTPSSNTQTMRNAKKPEIAQVIAPYQSSSTEQLSLQRGQLIMIRKKTDSGWWEGELQAKGRRRQVGWFPASYVKVLNSSGRVSGRTTPVSTTHIQQEVVIDKVVALYPYTAANPDELSFLKDDIISVTVREEPSWWRGELNGVSGLFPSNYVTPLQQSISSSSSAASPSTPISGSSFGPQDKMRQECINELIQTERAYIDDMAVVYEVFEVPLRRSRIVSDADVNGIFVNWRDILQCNRNFLADLVDRWNSGNDIIGDILCKHLPLMTAYITFCASQLESAALLQRLTESSAAFRNLVKQCQAHRSTRGMPLSSFLIKPMQRITRYPLLISKILDNTPQTYADHMYLKEALQIADGFLKRLNENVRAKENEERLQWLQQNVQLNSSGAGEHLDICFDSETNRLGPRKLLHYGSLSKAKSGRELVAFLLNDFFMLAQPSKNIAASVASGGGGSGGFYFQKSAGLVYKLYKQPILVKDLRVSPGNVDADGTEAARLFRVHDRRQNIGLLASTANECSLWLKQLEAAREVHAKVASLSKIRPKSTPHGGASSCGRLLVLVQKGTRFIRAGKSHGDNIYCKVSLGDQEQSTVTATESVTNGENDAGDGVPQVPTLLWNHSMQFLLRNVHQEILTIVVLEMCPFRPDEFLGRAEVKLADIYRDTRSTNGPITRKLILHQVESGEVTIKLDMQMFSGDY